MMMVVLLLLLFLLLLRLALCFCESVTRPRPQQQTENFRLCFCARNVGTERHQETENPFLSSFCLLLKRDCISFPHLGGFKHENGGSHLSRSNPTVVLHTMMMGSRAVVCLIKVVVLRTLLL